MSVRGAEHRPGRLAVRLDDGQVRAYLGSRFPLGDGFSAGALKGYGYGVPIRVDFELDGERRSAVIETLSPGPFGHEHMPDRAQIVLSSHRTYNALPRHARSLDVGGFTSRGALVSLGEVTELFALNEFVVGREYYHDLERLRRTDRLTDDRFVIESIFGRHDGGQAVSVSTTRLHNIAGKYVGKDDPVMLVRVQKTFPATGEVLAPYSIAHYVGGWMRGSHVGPLMPVRRGTACSYFDGPPIVSCLAFCVKNGKLTESVDVFDHPLWDEVRARAATKAIEMRRQGFSGASMLPYSELEYGGIVQVLERLDKRFGVRAAATKPVGTALA